MSYKTILVHCDGGKPLAARARLALDLAQRFDAQLIGVYVRPRFEAPIFADGAIAMDQVYSVYETDLKADQDATFAAYRAVVGDRAGGAGWVTAEGYTDEVLADLAHAADLVVVGQREPDPALGTPTDLPERLSLLTERPVIVVPHIGASAPVGRNVMLCWNGHREAGRAATGALPILKKAEKVTVLAVDPPKEEDLRPRPRPDIVGWLGRHGVKATLQLDTAADTDVGNVILSRAADSGADLVVMGVYGHSRMREMVMGGVSRTVLASMTVPILAAH
ncbi:MAG: universal stress protein [Alphaproteobacteria bacterium]|nr:universal stress protein [Alphaproteobacteria bacterium]